MPSAQENVDALVTLLKEQTDKVGVTDQPPIVNHIPDTLWTPELAITLSIIILVFGLVVFGVMAFLIHKGHDANNVLRVCALPLIIVSAIFLIVVGYSQQQIAPVMGLLGTVAGYLLGNTKPDKPS